MKLTFGFKTTEKSIELSDNILNSELKEIFKNLMGVEFNDDCYIIKDGVLQK